MKKFIRTNFNLILCLFLIGCTDNKKILLGERSDFLQTRHQLKCDECAASTQILISKPYVNHEWPQVGGNSSHAMPNLTAGSLNKLIWSADIGRGSSSDRFLLSSPVSGNGLIFTMDAQGQVTALNIGSKINDQGQISADGKPGEKVWSIDTVNRQKKHSNQGGGISFDQNTLYISTLTGEVWAVQGDTGEIKWKKDINLPLRTAPTVDGKRLFVITTNNKAIALSTESGEIIWRHEDTQDAVGFMGGGNPAIAGESEVIIPYSSGNVFAVRAENGVVLWHDMLTSSESSSSVSMISQIKARPVVDKHHIYVMSQNGHMMALNLLTGTRLWEHNIGSIRTPALGENVLFVITTLQQLICLTKDKGKIIWIAQLPQYKDMEKKKDPLNWAGPILASNKLIVSGSDGKIMAFSPENGQLLSSFETGSPILLSPIIVNGILYVLQDRGTLLAIQ